MVESTMDKHSSSASSSVGGGGIRRCALYMFLLLLTLRRHQVTAFSLGSAPINLQPGISRVTSSTALSSSKANNNAPSPSPSLLTQQSKTASVTRRDGIQQILSLSLATITTTISTIIPIQPALAYTPDTDPLRESLYLMSRVQEATAQQERFVNNAQTQDALKSKMKLTLRLVEKNYRLLDQITFASEYVSPASAVVEATSAGYESAEALQAAIDYVNSDLKTGTFDKGQKEYLTGNLSECRERLFDFFEYMPKDKVDAARKRVEVEVRS